MVWARLKSWAAALKKDVLTLWFCARHPRTPVPVKILALSLAAYALSPIDLIPDFIPILGYLDELILLPMGIALCLRLVPRAVLAECRAKANAWMESERPKPRSYAVAVIIVVIWVLVLWGLAAHFLWRK
jgi:uncharacterized membrane protein YkvA (DUF1232 family)